MTFDTSQSAYVALRTRIADRTSLLVPWVGAGLSTEAGLPTWPKLKEMLVRGIEDKARSESETDREKAIANANAISRTENPWLAFERAKAELGLTTFREIIKESLRPAASVAIPAAYSYLWRIRPRAILTLNLDRLATRAYAGVGREGQLLELASGRDAAGMMHVHQSYRPFVANLHGTVDDARSWVLTRNELQELLRDEAYLTFIRTTLLANTVLFIGLTPDDQAVGGHLDALKKTGVEDAGCHYWLTDRRDRDSDKWAEERGVRVIRYDSSDGHATRLAEFFEDLLSYVPEEPTEPAPAISIPDEREAASARVSGLERLRAKLNGEAQAALVPEGEDGYRRYADFLCEHDAEIYRAWYVTVREPWNVLFGYVLEEEVAKGGFGVVFRATDVDGTPVALKLLRAEHRGTSEMIRAFRRGVRSMRILSTHGLPGMVRFRAASEIPAFVAMDWVDGPTLKEAVRAGRLRDWKDVLEIGLQLTRTVLAAHRLPERVLHRDLRPSNVMLRGFWTEVRPEVVVLDFDLSWHRGSVEQSVVQSSAFGYLAPEQLEAISGVSTRHAAVDSFGLGMTLYFLAGGRDPIAEQHRHTDWQSAVATAVGNLRGARYSALPRRFARVIERCTQDAQAQRWDLAQVEGELSQLAAAEAGCIGSAELVAEGLLAGSDAMSSYRWNHSDGAASLVAPNGMVLSVSGDERARAVRLAMHWATNGGEERSRVIRWLQPALRDASGLLTGGGWTVEAFPEAGGFRLKAVAPMERLLSSPEEAIRVVERARARLLFMQ